MTINLFTYGSLMFPQVWNRVTHFPTESLRCTLSGYEVRQIHGVSYPALVKTEITSKAAGVLYLNLPPDVVARLDAFEGTSYHRISVDVIANDGRPFPCQTYLFHAGHNERVMDELWDVDEFAASELAGFLQKHTD